MDLEQHGCIERKDEQDADAPRASGSKLHRIPVAYSITF